jgi:tRNA(Ile)-lysidine synthase
VRITFQNFAQLIHDLVSLEGITKVAVATSGGADSMCLTILLKDFCMYHNVELFAITVDHMLRKDSTKEAKDVSVYLKTKNIKHRVLKWEHSKITSNIQKKARDNRYKLLCAYCQENKIEHLFVAHNYDDQAETVMLRILRGSGFDGIAGINSISKIHKTNIVRPLLEFRKSQIIEFLKNNNIPWFDDSSNTNNKFDRIKVRKLLQKFDQDNNIIGRLNLLAKNAARTKDFLASHVNEVFRKHCTHSDFNYISINKSDFSTLHEEIKLRLINKIIKQIHNDPAIYPTRLYSLMLFLKKLEDGDNQKLTLSKCKIVVYKGVIYFYKEINFIDGRKKLVAGENIWDKRYSIKLSANADNAHIMRLTKEIWSKIKPKGYVHKIPSEIIFSTPVILYNDQYYHPFTNIGAKEIMTLHLIKF